MIQKDVIQSIIETTRVEEVISEFVTLKKRGANYIGLCPFHNEKTPSFTVSASKGIYKCFGCGKAGDAVNFVMEHEHYTYPEALRFLAQKYHIEIVNEEPTEEQIVEQNQKESLYNIYSFAQNYFTDYLFNHEEGKSIGISYFKEREFSDESVQKFQLGYCPGVWSEFTQHALKKGYEIQVLVQSGLTIEKGNDYYDRFRGRVLFPIHNLTGRVIGFGGRILKNDPSKPKYINSPESYIYNKSKVLYGLNFAKNAIASLDNCYLVEGYTDVISFHQSGIQNVVASSGTSLTADQVRLIKRFTPNITILYDGDEAGLKASFRGIDLILEQGMNVKLVLFPEGEDPDSFARKQRPVELKAFLATKAQDFIRMKTGLLLVEASNDPVKKAGLIREVLSSVSII
ncbi:MAG: DNA primase, partial [Bacteroidales bacterium]|nr:DNA primase [Bacteroidales bacterium]